jgi:hypothetical protein
MEKQHNRALSTDRILIANFLGRWKNLFGICEGKYGESLQRLSRIIRSTILMTNLYVARYPLRQSDGDQNDERDARRVVRLDASDSSEREETPLCIDSSCSRLLGLRSMLPSVFFFLSSFLQRNVSVSAATCFPLKKHACDDRLL